jgi:hypothetical protein
MDSMLEYFEQHYEDPETVSVKALCVIADTLAGILKHLDGKKW